MVHQHTYFLHSRTFQYNASFSNISRTLGMLFFIIFIFCPLSSFFSGDLACFVLDGERFSAYPVPLLSNALISPRLPFLCTAAVLFFLALVPPFFFAANLAFSSSRLIFAACFLSLSRHLCSTSAFFESFAFSMFFFSPYCLCFLRCLLLLSFYC